MTLVCTSRVRSAYETGRLAPGDTRVFRPGGLELTAHAIALANLDKGARLLDLGCGGGDTVRFLRAQGFRAVGIDCAPNPMPVENSLQHPPLCIQARASNLPFADGAIEGIFAECSLSLIEDRSRALDECARVLLDGGRLIVSDLYARRSDAVAELRALRGACVANMMVREELECDLSCAGFSIEVWEDHSRALRECAARYLFEYGSLDGLWGCAGGVASSAVDAALRTARAGYFLLIAKRRSRREEESDER